jgi:phenylacetate-CoA ligase
MSRFDGLYRQVPVGMQNMLVSLYGVYWHWARFGGSYRKHLEGYQHREWFSVEEWQAYQNLKLKERLAISARHVPFYRQKWDKAVKSAAEQGDLLGIPLLEKDEIRKNQEGFTREDIHPLIKFHFHTSGTTGTPIVSAFTLSELRNTMALREVRSASWAGVSFRMPRATFSGRLVEPDPERETHIYRYNAAEKQVYFSAFHLKPQTAKRYLEAIQKHNIQWMTGYAVSFYLLAKYMLDQSLEAPEIAAIITTSEKLTDEMRGVIERAFHTKVFEEYSTVENALFASECEHGRLHVSPDVGVVEILRPDGSACEPGEVGEVVTTCLLRSYQPLIRYRLGDLAAWDPEPCPCGRHMPVIKEVVGRIEDVVTAPDGRQLVRFHGIFTDQPHVQEGQVIQESLREFTIRVVPTEGFNLDDVADIEKRMQSRLGHGIVVHVETVDRIPRTKSGKFQAVISKVK